MIMTCALLYKRDVTFERRSYKKKLVTRKKYNNKKNSKEKKDARKKKEKKTMLLWHEPNQSKQGKKPTGGYNQSNQPFLG